MEGFTETNPALTVEISYESYQRCLQESIEADEHFPWLNQSGYVVEIASIGGRNVTLKMSPPAISKAR